MIKRKIDSYEKEIEELKQQLKNRDLLLKHICHKCDESKQINNYGNFQIAIRKIKELAKTFN